MIDAVKQVFGKKLPDNKAINKIAKNIVRKKKRDLNIFYKVYSHFYKNDVDEKSRSIMNVPFLLGKDSLNTKFLEESQENGLLNLAGHRAVGGMRASIYNGVPEEGVDALIDFMKEFEKNNG